MPVEDPMGKSRVRWFGWTAIIGSVLLLVQPAVSPAPVAGQAAQPVRLALPDRLSDADFWALQGELSEPGGYFRITDNYTSNEFEIGRVFTELRATGVQGDVYLGVGPEQNLTYIAAIRPAMAFIVDIRRQAVMQHLMYKAVFELAKDRAEFLSLLFAKPRPAGLEANTPIQQIWHAYASVATDRELAAKTYARIVALLTDTRRFVFTAEESGQLSAVYDAFVSYGPAITTRGAGGGGNSYTFADLTGWSVDESGQPQSFLSSHDHYQFLKSLHAKNLIVPTSGDFGGPKTLRAIGAYLKKEGGVVRAFYLSNVEQYLFQDGKDRAFYANVAALPLDDRSVFIRPQSLRRGLTSRPLCPMVGFLAAVDAGRIYSNNEAVSCGRL
jgi:hypothetical protein